MRRGAAVLLLLALTACTQARGEDPTPVVRDAVERTLSLGSAKIRATSEVGGTSLIAEGTTSLSPDANASLRLSVNDGSGPLHWEARYVGGSFYDRRTAAGGWLKHTQPRTHSRTFWPLGPISAREMLGFLRGLTDVERQGTEKVRDVETTRYAGPIDLTKVPGTERAIYRYGTSRAAFVAWVDGQGRVVRFRIDVDADRLVGSNVRGVMSTTFDLLEFGVPVEVTAPANATEYGF